MGSPGGREVPENEREGREEKQKEKRRADGHAALADPGRVPSLRLSNVLVRPLELEMSLKKFRSAGDICRGERKLVVQRRSISNLPLLGFRGRYQRSRVCSQLPEAWRYRRGQRRRRLMGEKKRRNENVRQSRRSFLRLPSP